MNNKAPLVPITVAKGDGIGPEIMDAVMRVLEAAGARIAPEYVTIGEAAFKQGIMNGVTDEAWASMRRTKVLFKSPLTTPQGGGYKSVNVTMRKSFGMFANVRPVRTFEPYVKSKHAKVDMVIVRENEEDLYAGIEYRQTLNTCHSVKFVSRTGSELIIRYAFEYARANGRKKVTALVKDNIMKISDGLFHKSFDLVGKEYPEIEKDVMIVDIGMAKVADTPEKFDVLVTLNLYGDIVSDIASQVAGSVGLAGSMNLGHGCCMFEAVHGSAPDITGKGIANPGGLLNGAILMLQHIGQGDVAAKIGNAWLRAMEDGHHTADIAVDKSKALSTSQMADAIIACLGKEPQKLLKFTAGTGEHMTMPEHSQTTRTHRTKRMMGVDVFLDWDGNDTEWLGKQVEQAQTQRLPLQAISSRGMKVYPGIPETKPVTDNYRCRFIGEEGGVTEQDTRQVLASLETLGLKWIGAENLYSFDGEKGFTQSQGE
ncbi:MAG: NADP-dependent isocitrate dehydrogenase [Alphaproteobacteria bacterium]